MIQPSDATEHDDCDVAVLGGGPAGCAAAIALRHRTTLRVTLVEPEPASGRIVGESIPPDTRVLLEDLGVWRRFQEDPHEPCLGSCAAWGNSALGYNDFVLNPYGVGWHLDRSRFNRMLLDSAAEGGARIIAGRFSDLLPSKDASHQFRLTGAGGRPRVLTARYVIDATGRSASFARAMGAERRILDQFSVICGYFQRPPHASRSQPSRSQLSLLESQPDGWWYTAAVPGDELIVAFATDPGHVRKHRLADPDRWRAQIRSTRHISQRLAGCQFLSGSLTVRVANSAILRPTAGPGWYAVGDAATLHDPLTAGGLYNALTNGIRAADAITSIANSKSTHTNATEAAEAAYDRDLTAAFADYTQVRNYFYEREDRWSESRFWRKRHHIPAHRFGEVGAASIA